MTPTWRTLSGSISSGPLCTPPPSPGYTPADDTDKSVGEPLWRVEFDNHEPQDWTQDEIATGLELCARLKGSIVS